MSCEAIAIFKQLRDGCEEDNYKDAGKLLLDELLIKMESFKNVFMTTSGSYYFIFLTGESWRIKKDIEDNREMITQPIMNNIFFVDDKQAEEILKIIKRGNIQEEIINMPIRTKTLNLGMRPVEFEVEGKNKIQYSENNGILTINGSINPDNTIENKFASGIHVGHKIETIIK
jgi:hypothetical protein